MANKKDNYKKIRTILVYGKKKCIYMKPKGTREYVKSKGEFVLLSVYIKKMQKKNKKRVVRGGVGLKIRVGRIDPEYMHDPRVTMGQKLNNSIINSFRGSRAFISGVLNKEAPYEPNIIKRWEKPLIPDVEDLNQKWYQNYLLDRGQYLQNNKSKRKAKESYRRGVEVRNSIKNALNHKDKQALPSNVSADLVFANTPNQVKKLTVGYA